MKKYIILLISLASVFTSRAQLSAEIDVERTVVPRLELQKPLASMMPSVVQGSDGKLRLNLSEYSGGAVQFAPQPVGVGAPAFSGLPTSSPYKGYVWGGYFPAYNAGLGAGYRFIDNTDTQVEAAARFSGQSYHNNLDDVKSSARDNSVGLHASGRHSFSGKTTVHANADYSFSSLRIPEQLMRTDKRKINRLRAEAGVEGREDDSKYSADAFVDYFGTRTPEMQGSATPNMVETVYGLRGRYDGELADSTIGYWLAASVSGKHRSGLLPFAGSQIYSSGSNGWQINVQPGVRMRRNIYTAEIGLNVDYSHNLGGKAVQVSPEIRLAWTPSGLFSVYGYTTGGSRLSVQNRVYNYSPFASGIMAYGDMFTLYDARVGVAFGPVRGISLDIYARGASTRRAPMITRWSPFDIFLEPRDVKGFAGGIGINWQHARGQAHAGFEAMQHSAGHAFADAPDRPGYTAYFSAEGTLTDRIGIHAGWDFRGARRYYNLSGAESLGNISNVSIGGSYRFDSRITFTLTLDNILCRRALILPGLRQSPLTGFLAASYLF